MHACTKTSKVLAFSLKSTGQSKIFLSIRVCTFVVCLFLFVVPPDPHKTPFRWKCVVDVFLYIAIVSCDEAHDHLSVLK